MIIMVIGARDISEAQGQELKNWLTENYSHASEVISGGAIGTDTNAKEWAQENDKGYMEYAPNYTLHGKAATHVRNADMIKAIKAAQGEVIAYQPNGPTSGTQSTIKGANKASVKVTELKQTTEQAPIQYSLF